MPVSKRLIFWCDETFDPTKSRRLRGQMVVILVALTAACIGCGCGGRPDTAVFDAAAAAAAAFATLDTSQDGSLSSDELRHCPGIHHAMDRYDVDGDKKITRNELEQRLASILDLSVGRMEVRCEVHWNGRPIQNATIRLIPEPFLGKTVPVAEGVTDASGLATMRLEGSADSGMQIGIYRVAVTHPQIRLPEKFNNQTTLGCDVAPDVRSGDYFVFQLKN